ncbi:hypothetical protein BGZ98_002486 [Dissophora globulifera]|nr:hypothetical protein BGZ98_002486 [Dissophora globulifera]
MTPLVMDYGHANLHMKDLKDLDAEGMLSEHWESDGDSEQERERELASHGYGRDKSHRRGESMDTDSSYRTNNSSVVRFDLGPESETSRASSRRARRKRESNRSEVSVDTINNTRSSRRKDSEDQSQHAFLEMEEVGKLNSHSWPHRNKSTTGIVTGLAPEIDAQSIVRSHSSLSRHPTQTRPRDPRIEKYLYHSRANSPADSSAPSSASNHRSRSRSRHRQYQYQHIQAPFSDRGTMSDMTPTPSELDAMRSKAGSRAAGTLRGTTLGGSGDASSVYGTEMTQADEHNYLAPLPPFQQGPAYAKVPKRRFCKWCFGGCRWWVLLMLIIIPAGIAAVIAAFFLHQFYICFPVNPSSVDPYVYTIDPTAVQNLILDYQTQTKGNIAIIDSPNANETNILLKLQRRFYQMKYSQDLTGFQIETLPNGTVHYVLNDIADSHRKFYLSTVLCSTSILTIEMPRAALGRPEISIDAFVDQQDVLVDLDETVARNSTWRFKGISDHSLLVKSLNVNALSVSYTSTSPSTLNLASVIVRDQLSVVSVSGDIQVSVGFSNLPSSKSNASSPSTVNLNTLDGNIQLDMKAWNQSSTFQVSSPNVQVSKAGQVLLPYTSGRNGTSVNYNGLIANAGPNSVSGSYVPQQYVDTHWTQPTLSASNTLTKTATGTAPIATMTTSVKPPYSTTSGTKSGTATVTATVTTTAIGATPTAPASPPGPALGAGGSSIPAQFIIQANKDVSVNFP